VESAFLAFLGVSMLVIVTPGPDTALTIRNSLLGGRAGGIGTALGVSTGQLIWALATSAGLAAILAASEPLFHAVTLATSSIADSRAGRLLVLSGAESKPGRTSP
jgi:threonine/homoserine/homoserine lactone efflux protein